MDGLLKEFETSKKQQEELEQKKQQQQQQLTIGSAIGAGAPIAQVQVQPPEVMEVRKNFFL